MAQRMNEDMFVRQARAVLDFNWTGEYTMPGPRLYPQPWSEMIPPDSFYARLAKWRDVLLDDEYYAALYKDSPRGRPSILRPTSTMPMPPPIW